MVPIDGPSRKPTAESLGPDILTDFAAVRSIKRLRMARMGIVHDIKPQPDAASALEALCNKRPPLAGVVGKKEFPASGFTF